MTRDIFLMDSDNLITRPPDDGGTRSQDIPEGPPDGLAAIESTFSGVKDKDGLPVGPGGSGPMGGTNDKAARGLAMGDLPQPPHST